MDRGVGAVAALCLALVSPACTGGNQGADTAEFCEAYLAFVEVDSASATRDDALRAAAEVAPDDVRAVLDGQLALIERGREVAAAGDDVDMTGDLEYMELVLAYRSEGVQRASERLEEILTADCGVERTPVAPTPFTGVIGD
jgi:hypothetical protein